MIVSNRRKPLSFRRAWVVASIMGLIAGSCCSQAQTSQTWSFSSDLQGWSLSGHYGDTVNCQTQWQTSPNCDGTGSLRIIDQSSNYNPYAVSPTVSSVDYSHSYALSGWFRSETDQSVLPGVLAFFKNGDDSIALSIGDTDVRVQTSHYASDTNGWKRFVMRIPQTALGSMPNINRLQWAVRPIMNNDAFSRMGQGGFDQLSLEKWLEEPINIRPYVTTRHTDYSPANDSQGGWIDQGDVDMRNLSISLGEWPCSSTVWTVFNIPFEFIDPYPPDVVAYTNNGKSVMAVCGVSAKPWYTSSITVPVSNKAYNRIYLIHTAIGGNPQELIGNLVVTYSDNSTETKPIRIGYELNTWTQAGVQGKTQAWMMRRWVNPSHTNSNTPTYLFATSIELGLPVGQTITSLAFNAAPASSTPWMVLAATGATGTSSWLDLAQETNNNASSWQAFVPNIHGRSSTSIDLSFLLDPPAGKYGHVKNIDGHLYFENGGSPRRAKFWGTNIHSYKACLFPTHDQADQIASTLAGYGINLVRLAFAESVLMEPTDSTRTQFITDDSKWEKFEYLFHALKQKGIYVFLGSATGLSSRQFPATGSSVYRASDYNPHRSWAYYDSILGNLASSYMATLLNHPNRHEGGIKLVDDPALAAVEMINEQSVFWEMSTPIVDSYYSGLLKTKYNAWLLNKYGNRSGLVTGWALTGGGTALGASEDPVAGTVEMETYASSLTGTQVLANAVSATATESQRIRARDNVRFLQDIQKDYYAGLRASAQSLGLQCPIVGTNIISDLAEIKTHLPGGLLLQNLYWDHITIQETPAKVILSHNRPEISINPLAMDDTERLAEVRMTATRTNSAAMGITETDTMWPNEWRSSHLMSMAAIAALQDHDMLTHFSFAGSYGGEYNGVTLDLTWDIMTNPLYSQRIMNSSLAFNDPAALSGIMAGAFLFLRSDMQPANNLVQLQIDDTMELSLQNGTYLRTGYPANYLTYVTRFENAFLSSNDGMLPDDYQAVTTSGLQSSGHYVLMSRSNLSNDAQAKQDNYNLAVLLDASLKSASMISASHGLQNHKLVSETGQLVRDWGNQIMTINTPKSQGFSGFPGFNPIALDDMTITSRSPYCTFQVSSMDNLLGLDQTPTMFVIAMARADNQVVGRRYTRGTRPTPMGILRGEGLAVNRDTYDGPVVIEPVKMSIQMAGSSGRPNGYLRLTAINADMTPSPQTAVFPVDANNQATVVLEHAAITPWYLLERRSEVAQSYSFDGSVQNWGIWGWSTSDSRLDTGTGHGLPASLKVVDTPDANHPTSNPYAISPSQAANRRHAYRFSGWFKYSNPNQIPDVYINFCNASGGLIAGIHWNDPNVYRETSTADSNGWKKFTMYVPASRLSSHAEIASARYCIRALPESLSPVSGGTGISVWLDDLAIEELEGHALAWQFSTSVEGWQFWGWNGGASCYDATQGHALLGSLKVVDTPDVSHPTSNPYAISPELTADNQHGCRFSGWYRYPNSSDVPDVYMVIYNSSGQSLGSIHGNHASVQRNISDADSAGWRRLTMYVPKTLLVGQPVAKARFCVRALPEGTGGISGGTGRTIWLDELNLEMMPE